jgi:hypothetical protein
LLPRVVKGTAMRSASLMTGEMLMGLLQETRRGVMLKLLRTLSLIKSQMMTTALLIAYGQRSKKIAERTT